MKVLKNSLKSLENPSKSPGKPLRRPQGTMAAKMFL